jgi:hypothetical protein
MATNTQQFLLSVADAILIDKESDSMVLKAKALMNSALKQAVESMSIKGGFGNKLLFEYNHDKMLDASIESATWDESYLAINNNALITTGADNIYIVDEIVVLTAGVGSVAQTPVGTVYVQKADGTFLTVTPNVKEITVAGGAATTVKVTYKYSTSVDKIIVGADTYPKAYRLILKAKLFQSSGGQTQTGDLEIIIENYKISGNYEITFSASGASTSKIDGKALVATNSTTGEDYYAEVRIKPLTGSAQTLTGIALTPGTATIDASDLETLQLTVIGIQGGVKANITNPTGTTFASSDAAKATVHATSGLVTAVAAGSTTITATNGSLTDICVVTVQA